MTDIYTLSLHDALPILLLNKVLTHHSQQFPYPTWRHFGPIGIAQSRFHRIVRKIEHHQVTRCIGDARRSEEHTSELQSRGHLVCRLLLEKKKSIIAQVK